jgi:hypothetical protein
MEASVANEVVAHYLDGRIIKGRSLDVDPARLTFHIKTLDQGTLEVKLKELKALFFVKDLDGDSKHEEAAVLDPGDARARGALPIEVEFADKERIVGLTLRYPPVRPFFFILPADLRSNNLRILVNRSAVVKMSQPKPRAS